MKFIFVVFSMFQCNLESKDQEKRGETNKMHTLDINWGDILLKNCQSVYRNEFFTVHEKGNNALKHYFLFSTWKESFNVLDCELTIEIKWINTSQPGDINWLLQSVWIGYN